MGLVVSSIDKSPLHRVANTLHDDHIPHALEQVRDETTGLVSAINHPFDNVEQCCTVAIHERLNGRIENDALRHTQLARDLGVRHPAGSRSRNHLTEDRQRVPHASGSRASHQCQGRWFGRDVFGLADGCQVFLQILVPHEPECVVVRPRSNSGETLSGSVVAKMKRTCSGGSSTNLSKALKPAGKPCGLRR